MHKSATKCNETVGKWCKNKHGASKIMDTSETYQEASPRARKQRRSLSSVLTLSLTLSRLVFLNRGMKGDYVEKAR
jgi:hypothetical protein